MQNYIEKIKQRPWNSRFFELPKWAKHYPTMLTQEELRMLAWLAMHVEVKGTIVDLGTFLGGASVCFSWGVSKGKYARKVYSFDRFEIDEKFKYIFLYKRGHEFFPGTDALPIFEKFTHQFSSVIKPIKGDILEYNWNKNKISILFIDLAKTKEINDHVLLSFFPSLQPGSIIIQQDFLFYRNPWLYPTMYKLSGSIEFLSHTEDYSVIFGVKQKVSQKELKNCLSCNTTYEETIEAIRYYRNKFTQIRQIEMIDALEKSLKAAPHAEKAWQIPNASGMKITFDED